MPMSPYRVIGPGGEVVEPVSVFLRDLLASGMSESTLRSYSVDRLDPEHAGHNIGRIAAVAYSGLLTGPVVIGALASGVGLRDALLAPAALAVLVAITASVMRSR
jgi:hypothetical protein